MRARRNRRLHEGRLFALRRRAAGGRAPLHRGNFCPPRHRRVFRLRRGQPLHDAALFAEPDRTVAPQHGFGMLESLTSKPGAPVSLSRARVRAAVAEAFAHSKRRGRIHTSSTARRVEAFASNPRRATISPSNDVELARAAGGDNHGFRFIQRPFTSRARRSSPTPDFAGARVSVIEAARALGAPS